jgi:hypothetical protein
MKVDTEVLPSGSVIPDNIPPGHVSVQGASLEIIKSTVVERIKLPGAPRSNSSLVDRLTGLPFE